ncbi:hypothetical protein DSO57_1029524 [Entomophthora muscae]|uniref:Uncharacterized protein n=1 Tax=Entomophthora muscae TaxID=34485 RepID=A0ACC2SDR8_9FUNG|nr:hypothetical protein DSO57_1029524 [Entomophthora muscae]
MQELKIKAQDPKTKVQETKTKYKESKELLEDSKYWQAHLVFHTQAIYKKVTQPILESGWTPTGEAGQA